MIEGPARLLHQLSMPVVDPFARYPDVSRQRMFSSSSVLTGFDMENLAIQLGWFNLQERMPG